jgi:hypothetical protein
MALCITAKLRAYVAEGQVKLKTSKCFAVAANKANSALDWIRAFMRQQGAVNIAPKRDRKESICFSPDGDGARDVVKGSSTKSSNAVHRESGTTN